MYGIPEYRLPKQVVRQEIEKIEALGVTFLLNCVVGKQLNIDDILRRDTMLFYWFRYGSAQIIGYSGGRIAWSDSGDLSVAYGQISINEGTVGRDKVPVIEGEHVAVMGCGNVAMDAARTAVRMGAASVEPLCIDVRKPICPLYRQNIRLPCRKV